MARVFEVRLRNAIVTGKRVDIRKHGAEYVAGIVFVAYERKTAEFRTLRSSFQEHSLAS